MTTLALPFVAATPRAGFGRMVKAAMPRNIRARAARSLNHMDAHLLRDVGLTPPDADPLVVLNRAMLPQ